MVLLPRLKLFAFLKNVDRYRGYLLFKGKYQIYFIEYGENIRIFTGAQQFSTHEMTYIWYLL